MVTSTVRLLRDRNLLVVDERGGVAVIGDKGWVPIPAPLADLVRHELGDDDDAA